MKIEEKKKALELRREGWSLKEISENLNVSKSSASYWVRDVKMGDEQLLNLQSRSNAKLYGQGEIKRKKFMNLRKKYQQEGVKLFKKHGHEFMNGCMLYWAEGTKRRTNVNFTNSDGNMLKFFISFLKKFFKVSKDKIKLRCLCYMDEDISIGDVEKFWSEKLNVPIECFYKTCINKIKRKSSKYRQSKTKYGVCNIIVYDVKIVQAIYGAIQYYIGFKNDNWLNG